MSPTTGPAAGAVGVRLPNLLVIGVTKAGTTSLFSYLVQHPEICGATLKETEYFSRLVYPGATLPPIDTYARYFRHCGSQRYVMEASANYWYGGARMLDALERHLGEPRYVISLRDPVERFWSDFTYMKSKTLLPADLGPAEFFERCHQARQRGEEFTEPLRRFRTLSTGFYGDHLPAWWDRAGNRLHVVFFDDLVREPAAVVRSLLDWLELDSSAADRIDYTERNETIGHRSQIVQRLAYAAGRRTDAALRRHPQLKQRLVDAYHRVNRAGARTEVLDADLRRRLHDYYAPANEVLAAELRSRGCTRLPAWLGEGVEGVASSPRAPVR